MTSTVYKIHQQNLPATQLLSRSPSILSIIRTDDVNATAKKKTMLKTNEKSIICWNQIFNSPFLLLSVTGKKEHQPN